MPTCPNGHQSGADDWCDVCGQRIAGPGGAAGAVPPPPPRPGYGFPPAGDPNATAQAELCPQCRTPREAMAPFCEECRFNFVTNKATSYTPVATTPPPGLNLPAGFTNRPAPPGPGGPGGAGGPGGPGPQAPGFPNTAPPVPGQPGPGPGPVGPGPTGFGPQTPMPPGPGPHAPGPHAPGPHAPGPHAPGPHAPGPQAPGAPDAYDYQNPPPPPPGFPQGPAGAPQSPPPPFPQQPQPPQPPQQPAHPGAGPAADDWRLSPPPPQQHQQQPMQAPPFGGPQHAPQAPPAPQPPVQPAQPSPPPPPPAFTGTWTAVIGPDREYFLAMMQRSGPDAGGLVLPAYSPEQQLPLTGTQVTVGRRRQSTGEAPDIDLSVPPEDPGVSHQHAVLVQQPDGSWAVVDQNSTNGTTLNGAEDPIQPYVPVPLTDGDRVHVGAWTTITIRQS